MFHGSTRESTILGYPQVFKAVDMEMISFLVSVTYDFLFLLDFLIQSIFFLIELPRKVECTACGRNVNPAHGTICRHPCLNVLVCKVST